jgi:hypothetical protein
MGFSSIAPRPDVNLALRTIDLWSSRADAAIISREPPWQQLLAGGDADVLARESVPLADYYRAKGHELWVYLEPCNGLDRSAESDALVRAGRSLRDPFVQLLFRRYAVALNEQLRPAHLGLALETNLIRALSPPELYAAVREVTNATAVDIRARGSAVRLSVSVQADYAWGRPGNGGYRGVDVDFADFPFIQELGISSYPYLAGFAQPEDLPLEFYSRLVQGRTIPVAVTEGGWTSEGIGSVASSPDLQRRYVVRQAQLLDAARAIAVLPLTFTDLDLAATPQPPGSILPLFARLGLVDIDLKPKPALEAWDAIFARPRR